MEKMTITEALAEIKTIGKRIEKKQEFVNQYLVRPENMRDPLDKEGGSEVKIRDAVQGITDLYKRWVALRLAIQKVNYEVVVMVGSEGMTIAQWLIWRREVAQGVKKFWDSMAQQVVAKSQFQFTNAGGVRETWNPIVSYPASAITEEREKLEQILGDLDGQLSLKNATTFIEI